MIQRKDGTQFITEPYRVRLSKSRLKRKIKEYSETYGKYVSVNEKKNEYCEVVLSKSPGALLGEHVRSYFSGEESFIYCEEYGRNHIIFIIVNKGNVIIDRLLSGEFLSDELLRWIEYSKSSIKIFYSGKKLDEEIQTLLKNQSHDIVSIENLPAPILDNIKIDSNLIAKNIYAGRNKRKARIVRNFVIISLFIITGLLFLIKNKVSQHKEQTRKVVNLYASYQSKLSQPSPTQILEKVCDIYDNVQTFPMIALENIQYKKHDVIINAEQKSLFSYEVFDQWAQSENIHFKIFDNKIYLTFYPVLKRRERPQEIVKLNKSVYHLLDQLRNGYAGMTENLGPTRTEGIYHSKKISIKFNSVSSDMLRELAYKLQDYPLVLDNIRLSVTNGLLNGTIDLQLLGK